MTRNEFRTLYTFNDWANDRLCKMLYDAFGEERNLRDAAEERVRSLQEAAVHIIASQAIWRSRWQGTSPTSFLPPEEYPTPLSIRMAFGAERARFWGYFAALESDEALGQVIAYTNLAGEPFEEPLWHMMQHVITHGCYHRGQITGRLLDMGFEEQIVSTDLIGFYRENP
jgi:uncharacterized damage-inducible protein DinB